MQFIYTYWHGGAQSDELRWSLRSVADHYTSDTPRALIVGDPPDWYSGPAIRRHRIGPCPRRGFRDVLNKIYAACTSPLVDDRFVWMMDDIYFLKPVTLDDLAKHYRGGCLPPRYKGHSNGWSGLKADTFRAITSEGLPLVDYCTHLPHVIEKAKWLHIWDKYGLADRVLQWELLYGAEWFRQHVPVRKIRTRVRRNGATFDDVGRIGNNSNNGWSDRLRTDLMSRFPTRSQWESTDATVPAPSIVEAVKLALSGDSQHQLIDLDRLLTNPVAELDRFAEAHDLYVSPPDYREALSLVAVPRNLPPNTTPYRPLPPREGRRLLHFPPPPNALSRVRKLAFVTCFFNPHRGVNRVLIYPRFAHAIKQHGDLFCIEGLFGGASSQVDSTWQVSIDPHAVFWHKESLLQLAIDRLPDEYDAVCWVDSDVIFEATPGMAARIIEALSSHAVVQPWTEIKYLGPDGKPISEWQRSMALANRHKSNPNANPKYSFPGMAWAARRDTLAKIGGMYTRAITGGGDVAWAAPAWNDLDTLHDRQWSPALVDSVCDWGRALTRETGGIVGMVEARAFHLYHGRLHHRQYVERNAIFGECNFDPAIHLTTASNGTLRWSPRAPAALRQAIARYMHSRREDE